MGGYGSDYDYKETASVSSRSAVSYNIERNRTYIEEKKIPKPPMGKVLVTKSRLPIVVCVDVTGSMRQYPKLIFEKLCILYNEIMYFLPEDVKKEFEISFSAVGDANFDKAPLQITDFAKGKELDSNITSLYPEGGGGEDPDRRCHESYELAAYYYAEKTELVQVLSDYRPIFFFISDETFYGKVSKDHVKKLIGDDLENDMESDEVFSRLRSKFAVYNLRKSYPRSTEDPWIEQTWKETIGIHNVVTMSDPTRVVDVIIGIVAKKIGKYQEFEERLSVRQTPEQARMVKDILDVIDV